VRAVKSGSPTIPKNPTLPAGLDFFRLRREGIDRIATLGSRQWTDYNTHDPGITLLEAGLFAINDLAYRARWSVADLLAGNKDQPFYTAQQILTVNPVTPDDYRRLLIDLEPVRNAWVVCKECTCGEGTAEVKGLYDIYLELEADEELGDLNDRVIVQELLLQKEGETHDVTVEVRFPHAELASQVLYDRFLAEGAALTSVTCTCLQRSKAAAGPPSGSLAEEELRRGWRGVFYATLEMSWSTGTLTLQDVSLRFFTTVDGKNALSVSDLTGLLQDAGPSGVLSTYRSKERRAQEAVEEARKAYHSHRNLDEDLCRIGVVSVGQVAVCAEIEVASDADLELVQANAWLAIEDYLAPPIPFYSLDEMQKKGAAVEEIFDGPILRNGFLLQADLDAATLRGVVRASDLINLVMDIEGVRSVSSLLLTRYDDEGNPVRGAADPVFVKGQPVFDPKKLSASWLLYMESGQQPRLYHRLSNFKFRKNGLPFAIDQAEANATLTQLRGEMERPKRAGEVSDLPIPAGRVRQAAAIAPVQHLLPLVYGVGPEGLPEDAPEKRKAQARQLKSYLMVFEQLLGNAFEQVAHLGDLFSLSPDVEATYFAHDFSKEVEGYQDVVDVSRLDAALLQRLWESRPQFLERRNRFLDHVMARFGMSFGDYALLLTDYRGQAVAERELIADKLNLLRAYPEISGGRALAFDHRPDPDLPPTITVLKRRIALLLGYADVRFLWTCDTSDPAAVTTTGFTLVDGHGEVWARGTPVFSAPSTLLAWRQGTTAVLQRMSVASSYALRLVETGAYRLVVRDAASQELAEVEETFPSVEAARTLRDELMATAAMSRSLVVEHLLLRPKFPGDAIYRECTDCEEADPWSFRLTVVMPGWTSLYNDDLDWRDFANRTIQEEIPSHLLPKVCWVGDDGYQADPCHPVIDALTRVLRKRSDGPCKEAAACALAVYGAHADAFAAWYAGKEQRIFGQRGAEKAVAAILQGIQASDVSCGRDLSSSWSALQHLLGVHLVNVLVHGYAFSRFEGAWDAWLQEDAGFDWGEERLVDRVHAMLQRRLQGSTETDLCACAEGMLESWGETFAAWMEESLAQGLELTDLPPFPPPSIELCEGASFEAGTEGEIEAFLRETYQRYVPVSYRLHLLLRQLEALTNTYPPATLHDCEDGSDENPVRLNRTALGLPSAAAPGPTDLQVEPAPTEPQLEPPPIPHRPSRKRPTRRTR